MSLWVHISTSFSLHTHAASSCTHTLRTRLHPNFTCAVHVTGAYERLAPIILYLLFAVSALVNAFTNYTIISKHDIPFFLDTRICKVMFLITYNCAQVVYATGLLKEKKSNDSKILEKLRNIKVLGDTSYQEYSNNNNRPSSRGSSRLTHGMTAADLVDQISQNIPIKPPTSSMQLVPLLVSLLLSLVHTIIPFAYRRHQQQQQHAHIDNNNTISEIVHACVEPHSLALLAHNCVFYSNIVLGFLLYASFLYELGCAVTVSVVTACCCCYCITIVVRCWSVNGDSTKRWLAWIWQYFFSYNYAGFFCHDVSSVQLL